MAKNVKVIVTTIANGATETATQQCDPGRIPLAIELPSAFTGTTLTFKASTTSSGTPVALYNEGTAYSVTVSTSRFVALNRAVFEGVKFFKVVSGSAEGAERTINIVTGE